MQIENLWPSDARIVELGVCDAELGESLVRAGYTGWLGIAADQEARSRVAQRSPDLAARLVTAARRRAVEQNNADVLVLRGPYARHLASYRRVRHAAFVAVPWQICACPWLAFALLAGTLQWLVLRRFERPALARCGTNSGAPRLLVFAVRRRRELRGARRFIPHALGVEGFLRRLNESGVRHAVLRWFESLPALPPGEDLDLLVDDDAIESIEQLLALGPGTQPIDVYSVTGLPGSDYQGLPYFPPRAAQPLLDRAQPLGELCSVPAPEDHLHSLAYHALYHKGLRSGLPTRREVVRSSARSAARAEHDYAGILRDLAARLGIALPATMEEIDEYLTAQGWRPPRDMLARLGRRNAWVRALAPDHAESSEDRGLALFLLRERALDRGGIDRAATLLAQQGFQIVRSFLLSPDTAQRAAARIRGGNWGRGPWPLSGGLPAAVIVAYDPAPIAPTRRQLRQFPFVTNARVLCKAALRDAFNAGHARDEHCNVVHSSDNGREALEYLCLIVGDELPAMLDEIERARSGVAESKLEPASRAAGDARAGHRVSRKAA